MARKVYDYEESEQGELVIRFGDFPLAESSRQHQKALILAHPGAFTQYPQTGVGIRRFLLDEISPLELKSKVIDQLEADGQSIDKVKINEDYSIELDAGYQ